jgi:hypothetical protein
MNALHHLLRSFTIRLRMLGAIAMVMACFALVGGAGLVGGTRLKGLNEAFMSHSVKESQAIADLRGALGDVRRHEKDMVINYEDGVAVLKSREAWAAAIARARQSLEGLLAGEEDADNPLTREALERLTAYAKDSEPVLQQIQNGGYDTARTADKMLAKAKQHVATVEENVAKIAKVLEDEAAASRDRFDAAMSQTLWAFVGVLAVVAVVVVPLTLL